MGQKTGGTSKPIFHDRILYRERNRIERMFGHLKINRAVAIRYDQLAESFLSMIQIAATRYLLKFVHAALGAVQTITDARTNRFVFRQLPASYRTKSL